MSKPEPQFKRGDTFFIGGPEKMFMTEDGTTSLTTEDVLYMKIEGISIYKEDGEWYDNVEIGYYGPTEELITTTSVDVETVNERVATMEKNLSTAEMVDRARGR